MDKKKLNNLIQNDKELESILAEAMGIVGKENDSKLIDEIEAMSEEDFRRELAQSNIQIKPRSWQMGTYLRVAAAFIICALVIWGVTFIPFGQSTTTGYASMFQQYYTEYTCSAFDAKDDNLNAKGHKSTAQLIQDASELLAKKSRRSTNQAIEILEFLKDNDWRKTSLDPEIHWYLGLAYLKNGQKSKARNEFQTVSAYRAAHAAEAAELLQKL